MNPEKETLEKQKNNKRLIMLYLRMVAGIAGFAVLIISLFFFVWSFVSDRGIIRPAPLEPINYTPPETVRNWDGAIIGGSIISAPDKTNFLIAGTDAGELLTDVIIVGCFDVNLARFDLISIPRDTRVTMAEEDVNILRNAGRSVPSDGIMKINAIHAYAGRESGILFLKKQIEQMLGIKIDFYAEINLQGFRNIVDATGGIYMEIPAGGLYYKDDTPGQDLVIAVPGGMQLLNGAMAEGVVRYRSTYPRGDIQRIEVQHEFMKQFFVQALSKENIIRNIPAFITTVINYVSTDFSLLDVPKYIKYIDLLNEESINMHVLPGSETTIKEVSYYIWDAETTNELVYEIFYKDNRPPEPPADVSNNTTPEPSVEAVNIKRLKIQVLGSDAVSARETADKLRGAGFNVINTGVKPDEDTAVQEGDLIRTRIENADYAELTRLLNNATVITDPLIHVNYDMVIMLADTD